MKLVIEYDIPGSEGGTPDPGMARRIVDLVEASLNDNPIIEEAVKEVARSTKSNIPLGRRSISIERTSAVIYGIKE